MNPSLVAALAILLAVAVMSAFGLASEYYRRGLKRGFYAALVRETETLQKIANDAALSTGGDVGQLVQHLPLQRLYDRVVETGGHAVITPHGVTLFGPDAVDVCWLEAGDTIDDAALGAVAEARESFVPRSPYWYGTGGPPVVRAASPPSGK